MFRLRILPFIKEEEGILVLVSKKIALTWGSDDVTISFYCYSVIYEKIKTYFVDGVRERKHWEIRRFSSQMYLESYSESS